MIIFSSVLYCIILSNIIRWKYAWK